MTMGIINLFVFCFLALVFTPDTATSENLCETGWTPHTNGKCLKLFPKFKNLKTDDADAFCQKQGGSNQFIPRNYPQRQKINAKLLKPRNLFSKKTGIICEKPQLWSLSKLQNELLKIQEQLENVIPVGFIYVQLPREQSPQELWPNYTWADVSSDYDGVFFRTIGRDSAPFGEVQQAGAPRIVTVKGYSSKNDTDLHTTVTIEPNDELSAIVRTAYEPNPAYYFYRGLQFQQSAEEVRPRNMAVRVWQRTA